MIDSLPPGLLLIAGALLLPLFRGRLQAAVFVALPLVSLWHLTGFFGREGVLAGITLFDYTLVPLRVDKLSLMFALIFHVVALLSAIYAVHVRDTMQHVAALVYAGAAIGATFAGDLITLFVFWELTAISSVFLIWASRNEGSYRAGMRYLIVHVTSGLLLLAGAIVQLKTSGSLAFEHMELGSLSSNLIFVAFGIKCAFPFLHNWLQDAYPEATVTGTVFLSSFTTKLAIYVLARGFEGTTPLIWIGVTMTVFPIFFAVIENDLRRVLAYSLNNQLGFMVVGIGIGAQLALNGAVSHAFAHLLYKALLFMSMGAVLYRTGTIKATRARRTVQVHAGHDRVLHRRGIVDLGIPVFQRFCHEVDGAERRRGATPDDRFHPVAVRLGRRVRPLRHQDPVLRLLRARLGHPLQGGPLEHAAGDVRDGRFVHPDRRLPVDPDAVAAQRRRIPGVHGDARTDAGANVAVRRAGLRRADAHGPVPQRARGDQSRFGLDLPQAAAPDVGRLDRRRDGRSGCGAKRRRAPARLDAIGRLPPPRTRGASRPELGFRRLGVLGLPAVVAVPDRLLQLEPPPAEAPAA